MSDNFDVANEQAFFNRYPIFSKEGSTGIRGNRLHYRYRAIVEENRDVFRDARVLDIASHDGRWSLAALDAGARTVTGIEARPHLAEKARSIISEAGYDNSVHSVIVDDCFKVFDTFEDQQFDIVLCLGFIYHTMHHFKLIQSIQRVMTTCAIVDGQMIADEKAVIKLRHDDSYRDGAAIPEIEGKSTALIGVPSIGAVWVMLEDVGLKPSLTSWDKLGLPDWNGIEDYRDKSRFTIVAKP